MSLLPKITILADLIERDIHEREAATGARDDAAQDALPTTPGSPPTDGVATESDVPRPLIPD